MAAENYKEINKNSWNHKVDIHVNSDFYDNDNFIKGKTSLNEIERSSLSDIKGKKILHLQCHFGQDTISLARLGAKVTGVDISDKAIDQARALNEQVGTDCRFILSDVYGLKEIHDEQYDMIFTSYGVIGWLPSMEEWADVISHFLKSGGKLVLAEFHPAVWMFDDDFTEIKYRYFNTGPIIETYDGTYADYDAELNMEYVMWNHSLSDVIQPLINKKMNIVKFQEYDYSPYPCFKTVEEYEKGKYRIPHLGDKIPMVYLVEAIKQ